MIIVFKQKIEPWSSRQKDNEQRSFSCQILKSIERDIFFYYAS